MNKKTLFKMRLHNVKEFLPTFKSKKGSPTLEYVLIIAAGAAMAGLLLAVFKDNGTDIQEKFKTKIMDTITGATDSSEPKQKD
ncbi:hypothetical protein IC619_014845 [Hazenella sp. IB182353]|uniref:hypothetical protein n=1 Tax=Polycladospora coralii TaxID=2771432 RepID=UPI00174768C4|nr:hypothetical protein [Polycladospora coralii]MBS7531750.1 hypothetical protein [Polycladospora coralii]